jgi:hypothetical protein
VNPIAGSLICVLTATPSASSTAPLTAPPWPASAKCVYVLPNGARDAQLTPWFDWISFAVGGGIAGLCTLGVAWLTCRVARYASR